MRSKQDKASGKIWWLWFGFFVTFGYAILVAVFIHQYEAGFIERVVQLDLNEIGDFLAGIFAPLAFLWLFVATMMQSEELKLQRKELTENREVMQEQADAAKAQATFIEAQTAAMQKQTELNERQLAMSLKAGERAHRIAMFEKRIEIYNRLISISKLDFDYNWTVSQSVVDDLFDLSNRSEFMFDDPFNDWLNELAIHVRDFKILLDEYDWNHSRNKAHMSEDELSAINAAQDERREMIVPLRDYIKRELSDSTIVEKFDMFLDLNDPVEQTDPITTEEDDKAA